MFEPKKSLETTTLVDSVSLQGLALGVSETKGEEYLHQLFERQVDLRPNATAIISPAAKMTYQELDQIANQWARAIRRRGLKATDCVGVFYERSLAPIIAILACLKAGMTYIPLDPSLPDERMRYILGESQVALLLTEKNLENRALSVFDGCAFVTDRERASIMEQSGDRLAPEDIGLLPHHLCYVIFTSGTTGRPKGVMTEHRNAYQFTLAFNKVCSTTADDRIYQGFSLGFDGSVEEIWMAFSNGASLLVGTPLTPKFGNDVARFLSDHHVTYFSTVPTMIATMTDDVPSLRQLVVSGEVCPQELVEKWWSPRRRVLNVYGPTEATVNTTFFECHPGEPVTIGRAIPGYTIYILDADFNLVRQGDVGELFVGGPGLSRGYLNQPELSAAKFPEIDLFGDGKRTRVYRTGDLARFNAHGDLEFGGRLDTQVKIRGFRVELAEIESVLRDVQQVANAVVVVHSRHSIQELAAYVVLKDVSVAPLDEDLLALLHSRLPDYMVPSTIDVLVEFPTLASGKIDRSRLPAPGHVLARSTGAIVPPETDLERRIGVIWAEVFGLSEVSVTQNFFMDLGGHSLLAAQMATIFRERFDETMAVRDIYDHPTVRALADYVDRQDIGQKVTAVRMLNGQTSTSVKASVMTKTICVALQAFALLGIYGLVTAPVVVLGLLGLNVLKGAVSVLTALTVGTLLSVAMWPFLLLLSVAIKWLVIGRYKEGEYPIWGSYYFRWWLVQRVQGLSGATGLVGTPCMTWYFRLMGARVGADCNLESGHVGIWDLLSIGDKTSIGADTQALGYRVEGGMLRLGKVSIGSSCYIGNHSALGLDVVMGDGACLGDQSMLPDGAVIEENVHMRGSPASVFALDLPLPNPTSSKTLGTFSFAVAQMAMLVVAGFALMVPLVVTALALVEAYVHTSWAIRIFGFLVASPLLNILYCLWIPVIKKCVAPRIVAGSYHRHSWQHLQIWFVEGFMRASRSLMLPLFTTVYLPPWLRLLGAKIGKRAEMSAVWSFMPDLLTVGKESFFADGCILGGHRTYLDRVQLGTISVGERTFVGNSSLLPPDTKLGQGCLLGVLSVPPHAENAMPDGTDWLGSPPFKLPRRQVVGNFSDQVTFSPSAKLYIYRCLVDTLRVLVPAYLLSAFGILGMLVISSVGEVPTVFDLLILPILLGVGLSLLAVMSVVLLKWLVMGRFKPVIVPLWSPYVWWNEMVNGVYESVMAPILANMAGTPFVVYALRMMGCNIGKNAYIESTLFSEFDLVRIGDDVAINAGAIIQTHLFEDRIMKSSHVDIDNRASIGNLAVALYDAKMEVGSVLGPLSLLMKGESMPAHSRWHGIPVIEVP